MKRRIIVLISFFLILAVAPAASVLYLSNEEIINYANKKYPIIREENIEIIPVTVIYVSWAGLYTPDKIQLNKFHIFGYWMLDRIIEHELKHHECWTKYKDTDANHTICF